MSVVCFPSPPHPLVDFLRDQSINLIVLLVCVFASSLIVAVVKGRFPRARKASPTMAAPSGAIEQPPAGSGDALQPNPNLYATALHEAAHALHYGVSPEGVPPSLFAEVNREIGP